MRILAASKSAEGAVKATGKSKKTDIKKTDDSTPETTPGEQSENATVEFVPESESVQGPPETLEELFAAEKEKYLRLAAEYDNFRKRSAKEREVIYRDARADVITKLLPVYDNLERALKMECADESYYKGVEMIMGQLTETLDDMGVKQIPAVGEQFDPNRHNAVMKIEDPELGGNVIAEEYQKGFILGERIIRFSTVVVAN
jgi:molecular chaperone GrpE